MSDLRCWHNGCTMNSQWALNMGIRVSVSASTFWSLSFTFRIRSWVPALVDIYQSLTSPQIIFRTLTSLLSPIVRNQLVITVPTVGFPKAWRSADLLSSCLEFSFHSICKGHPLLGSEPLFTCSSQRAHFNKQPSTSCIIINSLTFISHWICFARYSFLNNSIYITCELPENRYSSCAVLA